MCKDGGRAASAAPAPGRMVVGLFGFVAGIGWFVLFLAAFIGGPVSFVWWTAGALSFAAAAALVLRRWTRRQWPPRHQLGLCFGAATSAGLFGLFLVAVDGHRANTAFQCAVIAALIAAYVGLDLRLSCKGSLEVT
jgi:drug/metabolite transporter (DMT)-like permease